MQKEIFAPPLRLVEAFPGLAVGVSRWEAPLKNYPYRVCSLFVGSLFISMNPDVLFVGIQQAGSDGLAIFEVFVSSQINGGAVANAVFAPQLAFANEPLTGTSLTVPIPSDLVVMPGQHLYARIEQADPASQFGGFVLVSEEISLTPPRP